MALAVGGGVWWPTGPQNFILASQASKAIASSGTSGFVFRAPFSGDITKIGLQLSGPADTVRVSVRLVDLTTGFPVAAETYYRDFVVPSASPTWMDLSPTDTGADGGGTRTVAVGEPIALMVRRLNTLGGGFVNLNNAGVLGDGESYTLGASPEPAWGKTTNKPMVALALDGDYVYPAATWFGDGTTSMYAPLTASAIGSEVGGRLVMPFNAMCAGAVMALLTNADYEIRLYTDAGSLLASKALTDQQHSESGTFHPYVAWPTDVPLVKGDAYRLTAYQTTTGSLKLFCTTMSAAIQAAGVAAIATSRAGGAWTDDATRFPHLALSLPGIS
jgi:hypothetical protein